MTPGTAKVAWPAKCCVPAFVGRAVSALSGRPTAVDDQEVRRGLVELLDVTLAADDPNPWGLRTSANELDWGVRPEVVKRRFRDVQDLLGCRVTLVLEVVNINEVAFEAYEDAVLDLVGMGAVVGVGFDYGKLVALHSGTDTATPGRRAAHLVRVTPLGGEKDDRPSMLPAGFGFDYRGKITIFDDSLEMGSYQSLITWRHLLSAGMAIDGAFWGVRQA